jgi:hypothetical protein
LIFANRRAAISFLETDVRLRSASAAANVAVMPYRAKPALADLLVALQYDYTLPKGVGRH